MKRRLTFRRTIVSICCLVGLGIASLGAQCTGGDAPNPFDPTVPTGNRPPSLIITGVTTPGEDYFAEQGDPVSIAFTGSDGEDVAVVRVFASTSSNPTASEEIPISDGFAVGPGTGSGAATWDTSSVALGSYQIFAEIDDRTYDSTTGLGNPAVRVAAPQPLLVAPVGTAPENGAPSLLVELPQGDAGLTNKDVLTVRFDIKDPNSEDDDIAVTYYFDKDRNSANDDVDPPLEVGSTSLSAGFANNDTYLEIQNEITIDLNEMPIRLETDEGGRPLPYYVRVKADDGNGGVVNAYASGAVRIVSAASDVVDLLTIGSTVAGATFQGFYGNPVTETRGARAGSSFAALGDIDGDGQDDFAIGAQAASPFTYELYPNVGEAYIIYGRKRTPDPDLQATGYAQGRFGGVISLNTVGTFKSFPPSDDRYQTIFSIRGNKLPAAQAQGAFGTLGITSLAMLPNITGTNDTLDPPDDTPELLIGIPYADTMADGEDGDPCDSCTYGDEDRYPAFVCFGEPVGHGSGTNEPLNTSVELPGNDTVDAGEWVPSVPPDASVSTGNVDLGLGAERILIIEEIEITIGGSLPDLAEDEEPTPFDVTVQLESSEGPKFTINVSDIDDDGQFEDVSKSFVYSDPDDPIWPISKGDVFPPSLYDGLFNVYISPTARIELSDVNVNVYCTTVSPESHELAFAYFDGLPSPYSANDEGCADEDPIPYDTLALPDVSPTCPPMNRSLNPLLEPGSYYPDGHLCEDLDLGIVAGGGGNDGINPNGDRYQSGFAIIAANDNLVLRLDPLTGRYLGEYQGTGEARRRVRLVGRQGLFGQPDYLWQGGEGMRGARFRGAWYNPIIRCLGALSYNWVVFDPTSLYGYTVDSLPEMNAFGDQDLGTEMLISAPGQGVSTEMIPDFNPDPMQPEWTISLDHLVATYDEGMPGPLEADFDFQTRFSKVDTATLTLEGTAINVATLRIYWGTVEILGVPYDIAPRDILLYPGAHASSGGDDDAPNLYFLDTYDDSFVNFSIDVPMTAQSLALLEDGQGTLYAKRLDDCVTKQSVVYLDRASLTIDEALVANVGAVYIMDGWDWTRNLESIWGCAPGTNGDSESDDERPMSWPSYNCDVDEKNRYICFPTGISALRGEAAFDAFGWAHSAGDVGGGSAGPDANPDIVCGSPLSDNDPWSPDLENCPPQEATPLTDNGKVFLIYGSQTLAQIAAPCHVERFEIRGTHDDDQFGRCQGAAGDMNGDTFSDFFVAAEGYDADGTGGVPNKGVDAGFVGVVFASTAITGERTIRAEQIGTENYLGCKFIGGSAGARLGGGDGSRHVLQNLLDFWEEEYAQFLGAHPLDLQGVAKIVDRGQYGVSSAGDFNIDGFDDLLITAPGQEWPGARILFNGAVVDGSTVRINSITFEFDTNGVVTSGRVPVSLSDISAEGAQAALLTAMSTYSAETLGISSVRSQSDFPDPLPDIPTITFVSRRADSFTVTSDGLNISVEQFTRQGVAYLVFGSNQLLENNTFVLPDDLNRRVNGKRILKGVVFVSAYEKNTGALDESPDEAAVEVVSSVGDVDGDGFVDIILGAPQADFINILAPDQRRQSSGDAYLIYGNGFGLNSANQN